MFLKRALYTYPREPYIPSKNLYVHTEKDPIIFWWAHWTGSIILWSPIYIIKRTLPIFSKEPYILKQNISVFWWSHWKESIIFRSPIYLIKRAPYILSKEPYIHFQKKPIYFLKRALCSYWNEFIIARCFLGRHVSQKSPVYIPKRALYSLERALYLYRKRALYSYWNESSITNCSLDRHLSQKSPAYIPKRALYFFKRALYLYCKRSKRTIHTFSKDPYVHFQSSPIFILKRVYYFPSSRAVLWVDWFLKRALYTYLKEPYISWKELYIHTEKSLSFFQLARCSLGTHISRKSPVYIPKRALHSLKRALYTYLKEP